MLTVPPQTFHTAMFSCCVKPLQEERWCRNYQHTANNLGQTSFPLVSEQHFHFDQNQILDQIFHSKPSCSSCIHLTHRACITLFHLQPAPHCYRKATPELQQQLKSVTRHLQYVAHHQCHSQKFLHFLGVCWYPFSNSAFRCQSCTGKNCSASLLVSVTKWQQPRP